MGRDPQYNHIRGFHCTGNKVGITSFSQLTSLSMWQKYQATRESWISFESTLNYVINNYHTSMLVPEILLYLAIYQIQHIVIPHFASLSLHIHQLHYGWEFCTSMHSDVQSKPPIINITNNNNNVNIQYNNQQQYSMQ